MNTQDETAAEILDSYRAEYMELAIAHLAGEPTDPAGMQIQNERMAEIEGQVMPKLTRAWFKQAEKKVWAGAGRRPGDGEP